MAQDDKYGLEPADDKYGLQSSGAATATAEPPSDEEIEAAYGKDVSPKIRAAVKSGVAPMQKPTNFEAQHPQLPENGGFGITPFGTPNLETIKNVGHGVITGIGNAAKFGKELAGDISDPNKPLFMGSAEEGPQESTFHKYVLHPSEDQFKQAQSGDVSPIESIGHSLAGAVPLVGPWAAGHAQHAGETGNVAEELGQVGGEYLGGKAAEHVISHPLDTAGIPGKIADKVIRGTPLTEAGKLEAAKTQALTVKKPGMTETEYAAKVQDALPDLQKVAQDNAGKIKTPRDAVGAINRRVQEMEAPIAEHLKGLNKPEDMVHADQYHDQIDKAIDAEMAKHPGQLTAAEMEKAKTQIDKFVGDQPKTLEEVEGNRKRLNQDAEDYYKSRPADKRVMDSSDATAIAQRAAANAIRSILYGDDAKPGLLEKAGVTAVDQAGNPIPLREFRKKVGNLLEVRDHFEDAITRAEQTGNWKAFDKMATGPSLAAGGLGAIGGLVAGGPIGALFGTLAGEGVKAWGDYLRSKNPNLNVTKMFRNLENTGKPNTLEPLTAPVQHQYQNAIGPQESQFAEPIGPAPAPGNFKLEDLAPNKGELWQQQVGQPAPLETGAPSPGRHIEPIGPQPQAEAGLGPIQGQQMPLHLPASPEEAPLWNLEHPAPRAGAAPPPEIPTGGLQAIGGPGREGILGRIGANPEEPNEAVKPMRAPGTDLTGKLEAGESTYDKFYNKETNEWAPERQKMHDQIAADAVEGKTAPKNRPSEAIITVGGTAAGKTTLTRQILGDTKNLVNVDSDANKLQIPEYEGLKKTDPKKAAARVHDESKAISKRVIQEAVSKGLDFIYDTSTGGGGEALFQKLKDLGYRVKVVYADVPTEEAVKRSKLRAKESKDPANRGRVVPDDVVRKKHVEAAQAFGRYQDSPSVDEVQAYDTTEREPKQFYSRDQNGEKIHDQEILDRVKEKANEEVRTTAEKK